MGVFFALTAAFLWGVSSIVVSRATQRVSPVAASFVSLVPGPLLMLGAMLVVGEGKVLFNVQLSQWFYFGVAGVLNFVAGRTLSFLAIQNVGASRASPLGSASILVGPLFGILILHEVVDLRMTLGILAVFVGILMVTWERR